MAVRCCARRTSPDMMMAPAADMFELGVKVQVLNARNHVRAQSPCVSMIS